jgi:hypothetical protein
MSMMYKYDKVWIGILVGLLVPFVGYALLLLLLEQLSTMESLASNRLNFDFKARTIGLLALALNLLLSIQFFRKRRANQAMRGVLIATLLYSAIWIYYFGQQLLYPS